jgi:acyl-CoA reductase-like NAD-dependent aldehyde dehydrogenase
MLDDDIEDLSGALESVSQQGLTPQFAGYMVNRLFAVGLRLHSARSIVGRGPAGDRIQAATDELDRLIRDTRSAVFGRVADRPPAQQEGIVRMANALEQRARDAIALLEQQASLARPPGRLDYPTEIKRWRAFAEEAAQMARRWE